jgi:O-antigen/teichoic acid export membrane protein
MQRKFITNLFFLLLVNIIVKPFWIFGIDRVFQNQIGAEEYGFYYALFSFSVLLNIFLDMGITNYNNRNIAQHGHMLQRYFPSIVSLKIMLGVCYLIITLIAAFVLGYDDRSVRLLVLLCFNQFLLSFLLYLRSNIAGLQLFRMDSILSVIDRITVILICGCFLWIATGINFSVEMFVLAQTAAYGFSCLVAFLVLKGRIHRLKLSFNLALLKVILKQSLPFALLVLLMSFYYRVDSVMIERLMKDGSFQTGIYAQAYRLLDAATMIGFLFAGLLLPMFSKMIATRQAPTALIKLSFNLIIVPSLLIFIICYHYGVDIMAILYKENVVQAAQLLVVLMGTFIAVASTYIFGTFLTANGSMKELNRIALIGLLINLVLNFFLIPQYGPYGAALATLFTQMFVIISQLVVVKKLLGWSVNFSYLFRLVVFTSVIFTAGYLFYLLNNTWMIRALCTILTGFIVALVLRIIEPKNIMRILRNKDTQ